VTGKATTCGERAAYRRPCLAPAQDIHQITRKKAAFVLNKSDPFGGDMPHFPATHAGDDLQRRGESDTDASFPIVDLRASVCRFNCDGVSR
jgi:hypothetical protein